MEPHPLLTEPKQLIPTFSPQGDGNLILSYQVRILDQVDPYLFPARGRKHKCAKYIVVGMSIVVDPYLFPARGRKPQ